MDIYYETAKLILRIYQCIFAQDARINWDFPYLKERLGGAKIIAANHSNATDPFFLPFAFKEKLYFLIEGDIFNVPFFGWLLAKSRQIPVWSGQKKAALDQAFQLLTGGKTVVIFPEGRLNPERQRFRAATGTIRLSLMTGAPIIPVGFYVPRQYLRNLSIRKKDKQDHRGFWQIRGRCYIHIGQPWFPKDELGEKIDELATREQQRIVNYQCLVNDLTTSLTEKIEALVRLAALDYTAENNYAAATISY